MTETNNGKFKESVFDLKKTATCRVDDEHFKDIVATIKFDNIPLSLETEAIDAAVDILKTFIDEISEGTDGATEEYSRFSVCVSAEMKEKSDNIRWNERMSLNSLIYKALSEYLENKKGDAEP